MESDLPQITGEESVKGLQKEGFEVARQRGNPSLPPPTQAFTCYNRCWR